MRLSKIHILSFQRENGVKRAARKQSHQQRRKKKVPNFSFELLLLLLLLVRVRNVFREFSFLIVAPASPSSCCSRDQEIRSWNRVKKSAPKLSLFFFTTSFARQEFLAATLNPFYLTCIKRKNTDYEL
jgi:hypothetical protein